MLRSLEQQSIKRQDKLVLNIFLNSQIII